jgi:hypothetical protein
MFHEPEGQGRDVQGDIFKQCHVLAPPPR